MGAVRACPGWWKLEPATYNKAPHTIKTITEPCAIDKFGQSLKTRHEKHSLTNVPLLIKPIGKQVKL